LRTLKLLAMAGSRGHPRPACVETVDQGYGLQRRLTTPRARAITASRTYLRARYHLLPAPTQVVTQTRYVPVPGSAVGRSTPFHAASQPWQRPSRSAAGQTALRRRRIKPQQPSAGNKPASWQTAATTAMTATNERPAGSPQLGFSASSSLSSASVLTQGSGAARRRLPGVADILIGTPQRLALLPALACSTSAPPCHAPGSAGSVEDFVMIEHGAGGNAFGLERLHPVLGRAPGDLGPAGSPRSRRCFWDPQRIGP